MKLATILSALACACTFTACSSVSVSTAYDHSASFGKYKTYTLAPASHFQPMSPTSEAALRNAVHTELAARGITEVRNGRADLAVVPNVLTEDRISAHQYTDWGYGYHGSWPSRYGNYGMWAGAPRTYVDISSYTEGSMIIDAVDTRTKKLVFRGTATAVVDAHGDNAEKIQEAVKKMVAELPASSPN